MGMHFTACAPKAYFPSQELVNQCKVIASENGGSITLTEDVMAGTRDADVICTDVWVSMGEPDYVWEERINLLSPYQVNKAIMDNAGNAIFMHCLPAFHDLNTRIGKEIGENSASVKWRLPTRCLNPLPPWYLMKRKTGCIPSRRSWRPHLVMNSENNRQAKTSKER